MKKQLTLALLSSLASLWSLEAWAKLSVVTTVTDLRALVAEVGGDEVTVDAIARGTQDPHFIEAKPSYMTKASRADLFVSIGLDLEVGWVPSILQGARNPKIQVGAPGNLELGPEMDPLELPQGKVSRSQGDVHPFGNPHFTLDPIRMGKAAELIADKLGELDPAHGGEYKARGAKLAARLKQKTQEWQARIERSGVKRAVSYHKTLTYFFDRFHITNPAILEPKPGIPPTSGHILEVIQLMKEQKIPLVMVENYFDSTVTNRIKESLPAVRVATVPVAVDGAPGVDSVDALYERLVSAVEGK